MRTLFAKFLLWFWLGLAVLLGAEYALETASLQRGLEVRPAASTGPLALYAELARVTLAQHGIAGLDSLIEKHQATPNHVLDVYRRGTGASGSGPRPLPTGALTAAAAAMRARRGTLIETRDGVFVAFPIGGAPGQEMTLVLHPRAHPGERTTSYRGGDGTERGLPFLPADLGMRALGMLLLGGIGCFLLARYVTGPLARLQQATRRIAEGDLSTRVGSVQRRRRDELVDLGRDFDRMAERLEALVGAQRRLLADISHELRSPLARMKVALGLLRQQNGDDPDGMIARLELESDRLNRLIGDVLTLSRGESGEPVPESQHVDLGELARGIAADAQFEAAGRVADVRVTCPEPVATVGVPGLLHSALDNVVRNAVRHTHAATAVEITVGQRAEAGGREAVITVRDHGPGLPHDQLQRIFEPFYRFEGSAVPHPGGTGLGLTIAKRILARHGGTIRADVAEGGGLLVTLSLPAA